MQSQTRQYELRGQILALRAAEVLIKHEDIDQFMPGMTMPFKVRDGRLLEGRRGSAVVVTFIYVRCPLPQFCPRMDRRFVELQKLIRSDWQLADRSRLLSVSFDPDHDSPASLRAHAARLVADPQLWRFATADREVIDRFAVAFGVNVIREADRNITHNLQTAVIGPDRRLVAAYSGGDWTTTQITDDLRNSLAR